jgi:hypothetical protein
MAFSNLIIGMGFGLLCAATCLAAGFGLIGTVIAYAVGGALNILLLTAQPMEPAEHC